MGRKHKEEECEDFFSPCCSECKQSCTPTLIDLGIGPYEYWGQRGNDVNLTWLSDCCEAEIVEESSLERGNDEKDDPVGDDLEHVGLL